MRSIEGSVPGDVSPVSSTVFSGTLPGCSAFGLTGDKSAGTAEVGSFGGDRLVLPVKDDCLGRATDVIEVLRDVVEAASVVVEDRGGLLLEMARAKESAISRASSVRPLCGAKRNSVLSLRKDRMEGR